MQELARRELGDEANRWVLDTDDAGRVVTPVSLTEDAEICAIVLGAQSFVLVYRFARALDRVNFIATIGSLRARLEDMAAK